MADDLMDVFDRRHRLAAVRATAATAGLSDQQVEHMLDSDQFHKSLHKIDVEAPDFGRQVSNLVRGSASSTPSQSPATQASGAQEPAGSAPRQWTQADLDALPPGRAGDKALNEAIEAGLLVDMGYGPKRRRR